MDSGIADPRDAVDGGDEVLPALALRLERRAASGREAVEASPALAGFLDPAPDDPAALLESIEQGIERRDMEHEHALRARLDQLLQLVSMSRLGGKQGEDEKLRASLLELIGEHGSQICVTHTYVVTSALVNGRGLGMHGQLD